MDEIKLKRVLDVRLRLDNAIKRAEVEKDTKNILYETLIRLQEEYNEGKLISKRENEAYIKGTVLWELIERAIESSLGMSKIDFYTPIVYKLLLKTLEIYEVFQNKNPNIDKK